MKYDYAKRQCSRVLEVPVVSWLRYTNNQSLVQSKRYRISTSLKSTMLI